VVFLRASETIAKVEFIGVPMRLLFILLLFDWGDLLAAFDPCDNFDLKQCDPAAECFSDLRQKPECRCPQGYVGTFMLIF
jgi:hypothetical protein